MSEPDKSGLGLDSMTLALPVAILFFVLVIFVFRVVDTTHPSFSLVLWGGIPLAVFVFVSLTNLIAQQYTCGRVNPGSAFFGGLPAVCTTYLGLAIASVSYCRIPVASVFGPLIAGESMNIVRDNKGNNARNSTTKRCCTPTVSLESIERAFPDVKGCSYGFYVMFSILFGFVFGNGLATIC